MSDAAGDGQRVLAAEVPIRPAATVMLVRDPDVTMTGPAGLEHGVEVFMLQRTLSAAFARGQFVFPGGRVDDADHAQHFEPICDGLDDRAASELMGLDHGGLAWLVAAIRECFEEAGVLLARRGDEPDVVSFDRPEVANHYEAQRLAMHDGERTLVDMCEADDLVLLTDRLHLVAHWLTPLGERRRFDTRFFVAHAPATQVPLHDDRETIASLWVRPADALDMWAAGELAMFPPTVACLRYLQSFPNAAAAVEAARHVGVPERITPRFRFDGDGNVTQILVPGDEGFADAVVPEFVLNRF